METMVIIFFSLFIVGGTLAYVMIHSRVESKTRQAAEDVLKEYLKK
jgi:hypothetical protein